MKIEVEDINIKEVLLSGACFRIIEESDGSFTNIIKDRIVNIKQEGNTLIIKANNYDNLKWQEQANLERVKNLFSWEEATTNYIELLNCICK